MLNAKLNTGVLQVHFKFPREKVRCYFNSYTTYEQPKESTPKNEWEEDEEPAKDKPTPPKTSPQTKQVWKEKVASSKSLSQEVQPSRSPSLGPTNAPEQ